MLRSALKRITGKIRYKLGIRVGKLSYSQCGEDLLVNYIFNLRGIQFPTYLDIGANHPFFLSNTALFYNKGCRGINIEANPQLIADFNHFRKRDINLNVGIGPVEDELDFYIINDSTLSTFSREEAEHITSTGKYSIKFVQKVKLISVDRVITEYLGGKFPDFLSIDVEGLDLEILKSIDFNKYWPKVICVEAAEYSPIGAGKRKNDLIDFIISKGYYEYANTNLNAIMVKNEFWFI
jgi:FkbM family methyltransferase